ncbi:DUF202 domain-containing protein [Thermoactinospora rubra]|uniref:DUF202 domain-containing protein n=1 Tax=Thermoactinospora rubra TaxID=1088767 RepID=UPI000A1074F1|nr:DUF202 domain-containing protein [Thermoactinospora rubra]
MSAQIWDPGLQSERTRLAWVRSAVAMAAGGISAAGLAARAGLPPVAVAAFVLTALCGGVLLARTGTRFRRVQRALHNGEPLDEQADVLLAWLGTLSLVAGAAIFVLVRA